MEFVNRQRKRYVLRIIDIGQKCESELTSKSTTAAATEHVVTLRDADPSLLKGTVGAVVGNQGIAAGSPTTGLWLITNYCLFGRSHEIINGFVIWVFILYTVNKSLFFAVAPSEELTYCLFLCIKRSVSLEARMMSLGSPSSPSIHSSSSFMPLLLSSRRSISLPLPLTMLYRLPPRPLLAELALSVTYALLLKQAQNALIISLFLLYVYELLQRTKTANGFSYFSIITIGVWQ